MIRYQITKTKPGFEYGSPQRPTTFFSYFTVKAPNLHEARKLANKRFKAWSLRTIRRLKKNERGMNS